MDALPGHVVSFLGEDGRSSDFRVDRLPLPGWHDALAAAWHARIGPAGSLRTLASANNGWTCLVRFMRFLSTTLRAPQTPDQLSTAHVEAFERHREATVGGYAGRELRSLGLIFGQAPLRDVVPQPALDYLWRRGAAWQPPPKPGYSDAELRRVLAAARADVARLRDRLDATETLLSRYAEHAGEFGGDARRAANLVAIAETGIVPVQGGGAAQAIAARRKFAMSGRA